ncbi:MAG: hypothetical protein GY792_20900 [Gammaproteobacteria bacterium]|nr:hypothetical protein [Gammaproteobacteria bacterium]
MRLDQNTLRKLIPHTGRMCLLDSVESWDEQRITCTARSHHSADNPLRSKSGLSAINALEYGAQAMALHGGLCAQKRGERISKGYIVAFREAEFYVERLDLAAQPLILEATRLIAADASQIYQIKVSATGFPIAQARISVINIVESNR